MLWEQRKKLNESKDTIQSKEDAPKSQGKVLKRDNIQTQEDKMTHDMSLKMESKQIFKNSRETSPKRNIKKVWRPKTRGCKSHAKTGDSYEQESPEEDTHSRNVDHTIIEEIQVMKKKKLIL